MRTGDPLAGDVVFIDEPDLVRAIRARAPDALIVILPADGAETIFSPTSRASVATRARDRPGGLTQRERDLLARLATGETNAEIADALGLARNTVKAYLQSIMRKLGARNRVEALARARNVGIV